jgi:hypothetical protein
MSSLRNRYRPHFETLGREHEGSMVGEEDTIVYVLRCQDEKIEWEVVYFTPNRQYHRYVIGIAYPLKPWVGDVEGVWWVRRIW